MNTTKQITKAIKEASKAKTQGYDTTATVTRVEGDTVWIHIPGGVDETPVKKTVNASVGDVVQARVAGGSAWLVGNASAPPTDDTTADDAKEKAVKAGITAKEAKEVAENVGKMTEKVTQYFWHTETDTGAGAGAHITEVPKDEFLSDPTNGGGNMLATSDGMKIRNGLTDLAEFGADGMNLGYGSEVSVTRNGLNAGDTSVSPNGITTKGGTVTVNNNLGTLGTQIDATAGINVNIGDVTVDRIPFKEHRHDLRGGQFNVQGEQIGPMTLPAGQNNYDSFTLQHSAGDIYYPIGVVGYWTSGNNIAGANVYNMYLSDRQAGKCTFNYGVRNMNATASLTNFTISFQVLWIRLAGYGGGKPIVS